MIKVNENGIISFANPWPYSSPSRFPTNWYWTRNQYVVAPFWSDNDIRRSGSVHYANITHWLYPLLLALPSATGSTLCYWLYPLLLALPSATGSTLCYWLYPLLLALPSATGSTLCYWLYPLLLALPSNLLHSMRKRLIPQTTMRSGKVTILWTKSGMSYDSSWRLYMYKAS